MIKINSQMVDQQQTTATNGIIVMVGLPACGKSTLSVILAEQLAVFNQNVKVIELDYIFNQMPEEQSLEGKWQQARQRAFQACTQALQGINTTVIIDDTNDYRSMRKPYYRLAQMRRVKYLEIHFSQFTFTDSMIRDAYREKPVGPDTITKMAKRIEYTDCTEKQDWCVVFQDFEQIYNCVRYEMRVPEPLPPSESILVQAQNHEHIIDLKLRKAFKELMEANPVLKKYARQMNEIRRELMNEEIYDGDDHVNEFVKRVNKEIK